MTFSATLSGTTATIVLVNLNSTANLMIEGATNLGDQLLALLTDPSTAPVDSAPNYQAYPTDSGIRITTTYGHIDLPWRWVHSIGTTLAA